MWSARETYHISVNHTTEVWNLRSRKVEQHTSCEIRKTEYDLSMEQDMHTALVEALADLYEAIALGPLDAAAKYGPDFDIQANLEAKAEVARAVLARASKT